MSIGADAADQMVREGIQITESAVRLAALGAKNLAALLIALAASPKSRGATTARRLRRVWAKSVCSAIRTIGATRSIASFWP